MRVPGVRRTGRDDEGFVSWVGQHGDQLLRTAYLLTGDKQRAEDLVQAVLTRALPRWRAVGAGDPMAYLRRSMVNERTDGWRRAGARERLVRDPTELTVEDHAGPHALRHDLLAALQTLPAGQRAAVVLRYFEDLSDDDIAGLLGCSESTVRSQVSRALVKLRPHLHDHFPTAERCTS